MHETVHVIENVVPEESMQNHGNHENASGWKPKPKAHPAEGNAELRRLRWGWKRHTPRTIVAPSHPAVPAAVKPASKQKPLSTELQWAGQKQLRSRRRRPLSQQQLQQMRRNMPPPARPAKLQELPNDVLHNVLGRLPYHDLQSAKKAFKGTSTLERAVEPCYRVARATGDRFFPWQELDKHLTPKDMHNLATVAASLNPVQSAQHDDDDDAEGRIQFTKNIGSKLDRRADGMERVNTVKIKAYAPWKTVQGWQPKVVSTKKEEKMRKFEEVEDDPAGLLYSRGYHVQTYRACPHVTAATCVNTNNLPECKTCQQRFLARSRATPTSQDRARRKKLAKRAAKTISYTSSDDDFWESHGSEVHGSIGKTQKDMIGKVYPHRWQAVYSRKPHKGYFLAPWHVEDWQYMQPQAILPVETMRCGSRSAWGTNASVRLRQLGDPQNQASTLEEGADVMERVLAQTPHTRKQHRDEYYEKYKHLYKGEWSDDSWESNMARASVPRRCEARTANGPCRAWAMRGCRLCRAHR